MSVSLLLSWNLIFIATGRRGSRSIRGGLLLFAHDCRQSTFLQIIKGLRGIIRHFLVATYKITHGITRFLEPVTDGFNHALFDRWGWFAHDRVHALANRHECFVDRFGITAMRRTTFILFLDLIFFLVDFFFVVVVSSGSGGGRLGILRCRRHAVPCKKPFSRGGMS